MSRPKLLDLFAGAGGAGMGYHRAGFDVVGVDVNPQPNYPFEFHQGDALEYLAEHGSDFDAVHASPPCQAFTLAAAGRKKSDHVDLVADTRAQLQRVGVPYAIENVPQAPLIAPVTLCGTSFDLPVIRHRSFELSHCVWGPPSCGYAPTASVPHPGAVVYPFASGSWERAWREHVLPVVWPWMTLKEARQAIPPPYTEYIGGQLMEFLTLAD